MKVSCGILGDLPLTDLIIDIIYSRTVTHFEPTTLRSPVLLGYWDGELGAAARVRPQDDRVTLFRPLRCGNLRPDARPPAPNVTRELAWMDGFGRVSPRYRVP